MDESEHILNGVTNRPQFKERRDLVYTRPDRARDKLKPYSSLELKIVKAKNLIAADFVGAGALASSDPFVEVFVDDSKKGETETRIKTLNPVWNFETTLEIKHPASVLLLQVMDYDVTTASDMLGFVELPVADLPVGERKTGWFRLHSPKDLIGTAPERLQKLLSELSEKAEHGEVYLEMTRKITSGDKEDENYAWCLPPPEFRSYPELGWTRRSLDAQALIDSIMDFKSVLLGGFIRPILKGVGFVLGWYNLPMTLVVLSALLGMSLRPEYFLSGLFGMFGLIILLLSDPRVSSAMSLQPATVPLTSEGYKLIAATKDTDAAVTYLSRATSALNGKVLDQDRLREFAAFSSHEGQVVAESYAELKRQLYKARKGGEFEPAIIDTEGKPLQKGAVVSRRGRKGQIVKCLNPDKQLEWKYEVTFDGVEKPEEVSADELEQRTDMRWMSSEAVLTLIPNSVEDSLTNWTEFFRSKTDTLQGMERPMRDLLGWKDKSKSATVACGSLGLAVVFIWLQRAFFFLVVSVLFAKNTETWIAFFAKRRGKAAAEKQAARSTADWTFYTEAEEPAEDNKTPLLSSLTDKMNAMFGKKS
jgi:hypothetical protein